MGTIKPNPYKEELSLESISYEETFMLALFEHEKYGQARSQYTTFT